ncbi:MAG: response regulator [Myxococcaceae bacterium]|nr:response regulator [Myxococcaceae bacterium]
MATRTILIVEDDKFARVFLKDCLAELQCRIEEAVDGDDALAKISQVIPDLVLLDLVMPKKSGLEVLKAVRDAAPTPPILVVSSLDTDKLIQQALSAGANGYISKPFAPIEVLTAVRRELEALK